MGWKLISKDSGGGTTITPTPSVVSDHVAILRSIQAPADVIRIAETVQAELRPASVSTPDRTLLTK